jgi:hypothetical protein
MNRQLSPQTSRVRLVIADVDGTLVTQDKVLTPRATESVKKLHVAGILFGITGGRPPKGMRMLIEPLQLTGTPCELQRWRSHGSTACALEQASATSGRRGRSTAVDCPAPTGHLLLLDLDWFVRDANAPHVAREAWTVQFSPTVVDNFDSLMDRVVKIVGVGDDLEAVARCETEMQAWSAGRVSAARSQPYYPSPRSRKSPRSIPASGPALRTR